MLGGLLPGTAAAQLRPIAPEEGFLTPPIVVGPDVFDRCATGLTVVDRVEVVDLGCTVAETTLLGQLNGQRFWMLSYRRGVKLDYVQFVDSLSIDELVLVGSTTDGEFSVLWHLPHIRMYSFPEQVETAPHGSGLLVSFLTCLNGTGGCAQHFLFGDARWSVLAQTYLEGLTALLPDGASLHKGRRISLDTLTGVQPIAFPGDPNCCPSGEMHFSVSLQGDELRLESARVVRSERVR
jgi:hypothetical protein